MIIILLIFIMGLVNYNLSDKYNFNYCYRKCCPINQVYNLQKKCENYSNSIQNLTQNVYDLNGNLINQSNCVIIGNKCRSPSLIYFNENVLLQINGSILIDYNSDNNYTIQMDYYCAERLQHLNYSFVFLVCNNEQSDLSKIDQYLIIGTGLSIISLLTTIFVYILLSELRNLHGKCLMSYIVALIAVYSFLGWAQFGHIYNQTICMLIGVLIYYCFLSSFFWLNTICFDIWWTFSGYRGFHKQIKSTENQQFLYYNCYAWGIPLLITTNIICIEYVPFIPKNWPRPGFGIKRCFFSNNFAQLLYLNVPVIVIMIINVVMFIWCIIKIFNYKDNEILHTNKSHYTNKNFKLFMKLMFLMGLNWIFEITSWFTNIDNKHFWFFTDFINVLHGMFLFLIFVCKKSTIYLLKDSILKLYCNKN